MSQLQAKLEDAENRHEENLTLMSKKEKQFEKEVGSALIFLYFAEVTAI